MKYEQFGNLWGAVAKSYASSGADGPINRDTFRDLLSRGGFSQTLALHDHQLLGDLVDWQLKTLENFGVRLADLPASFCETEELAPEQLFRRCGRKVGPDFLRCLVYLTIIQRHVDSAFAPRSILEIGSGYGGMSRLFKLAYPQARIVLTDIPPCLRQAEFYIRSAFPDARHHWHCSPSPVPEDADFVFVPADQAEQLRGQRFDLAVNTWSLGEMPDTEIARWFDLIENQARVEWLFLLNHVFGPVPANPKPVKQASTERNWLTKIGQRWEIRHFEIDPPGHCGPLLRSQFLGLAMVAKRINSLQLFQHRRHAARTAASLHNHQWVRMSRVDDLSLEGSPAERRLALLNAPRTRLSDSTSFDLDRVTRNLNIWRPDFDSDARAPFFALWNDIRMNRSAVSVRLMRIWLHMQWRQMPPDIDGEPQRTLFREEIEYANLLAGDRMPDPALHLPHWMHECLHTSEFGIRSDPPARTNQDIRCVPGG